MLEYLLKLNNALSKLQTRSLNLKLSPDLNALDSLNP